MREGSWLQVGRAVGSDRGVHITNRILIGFVHVGVEVGRSFRLN